VLKVLVVDDEENIRHMLGLVLRKAGYDFKAVADGDAALKTLLASPFDIVLCDIRMPKMTGHELLAEVRRRELDVVFIMMSAYGDRDTALQAIAAGAYDYLSKPFKRDEVIFTLKKAEEREHLRRENRALKEATDRAFNFDNIIAQSAAMRGVFDTVRKVAGYKTTVLLSGESGTGKELVARALHHNSTRRDARLVTVNCGAIPEHLLETELFGYVRGAFTDANRDKTGLFQEAEGGTLFLDEIAELPLSLQVKLLRVLQEGEIRRVGDTQSIKLDVRVVAASHKELAAQVEAGTFREDLFYRLNVLPIRLPPLRERREDIPLLVDHFLARHNKKLETQVTGVAAAAMKLLLDYGWRGNVRELENTMERAVVLTGEGQIGVDALPTAIVKAEQGLEKLFQGEDLSIKRATRQLEKILIERALKQTRGNRTRACELLDISHRTLLYKIKDYGLQNVE
jgi:two-component system, NtrC family, response regulator AtoC